MSARSKKEMESAAVPRPAATIVLCRPVVSGGAFQVLLVKRHDKSGFMAGAAVFPRGRVDAADAGTLSPVAAEHAARIVDAATPLEAAGFVAAAIRETKEEAGIDVGATALTPWAWWITPEFEPKRFDTRFFLAAVLPETQCVIDEHE